MACFDADEELARRLQKQFEEEEAAARILEETDRKLALVIAGSHDISDSDTEEFHTTAKVSLLTSHTGEFITAAAESVQVVSSDSDSDRTVDLNCTDTDIHKTYETKDTGPVDANDVHIKQKIIDKSSLRTHRDNGSGSDSDLDQTVDLENREEGNNCSDDLFGSESEPEELLIGKTQISSQDSQGSACVHTLTGHSTQHSPVPVTSARVGHLSDSDDSDRTIDPNEDPPHICELDELVTESVDKMAAGSSSKHGKGVPYEFKKINSTLHSVSDSDSEDESVFKKQKSRCESPGNFEKSPRMLHSSGEKHSLKKANDTPSSQEKKLYQKRDNDKNTPKSPSEMKTSPHCQYKIPKKTTSIQIKDRNPEQPLKKSPSFTKHRTNLVSPVTIKSLKRSVDAGDVTPGKRNRQDSGSSADTEDLADDSDDGSREANSRPVCQYGEKCYRKNPSHFQEFQHPGGKGASRSKSKSPPAKKRKSSSPEPTPGCSRDSSRQSPSRGHAISDNPYNLYLTKVAHIPSKYNSDLAVGIRDILSPKMGNLQASAQFNYMTDIPWLMQQYPASFRNKPLLIVHGMQKENKTDLDEAAMNHPNIRLCQARLEMAYGTHHTKMMFLLYDSGMRVVIHTANLIEKDWFQRTQGVWISPLFPKLSAGGSRGDSVTHFKQDLLAYLAAYKSHNLREWQQHIEKHDMREAEVYLIGSVPGRHAGNNLKSWGHMKLRKVLQNHGPLAGNVKRWPVIGQFSSIGTLGASADKWVTMEWLTSLSSTKSSTPGPASTAQLQLIYPTKENVRLSLEGYVAGGSLPYSIHVARKQPWFTTYLHQWKSDKQGRSRASPHIKTYLRSSPDSKQLAWFLVTSANLSKAAWGALEKNNSQLMIRSYELGVLLLPQHYGQETFQVMQNMDRKSGGDLLIPYDLPPTPYSTLDRPWIWDISYKDKPDTHGNMWCPS